MFSITIEPFLNKNNEYTKILVINPKPTGNLINITKQITAPKLSSFQVNDKCKKTCIYAIMDINNKENFMCLSDIPNLYNYLISNGYTIDIEFSKLMKKNNINLNSEILFYIN